MLLFSYIWSRSFLYDCILYLILIFFLFSYYHPRHLNCVILLILRHPLVITFYAVSTYPFIFYYISAFLAKSSLLTTFSPHYFHPFSSFFLQYSVRLPSHPPSHPHSSFPAHVLMSKLKHAGPVEAGIWACPVRLTPHALTSTTAASSQGYATHPENLTCPALYCALSSASWLVFLFNSVLTASFSFSSPQIDALSHWNAGEVTPSRRHHEEGSLASQVRGM